jgi:uncharacterized delta-60 repeat protein
VRLCGNRSIIRWPRALAGAPALLALAALLAIAPSTATAAAGSPDPSFGQGGLVATDFGPRFHGSSFNSVEATPDGGVVVWQQGPERTGGFRRYSPGGSLQPEAKSPEYEPRRAVTADGKTIEIEPGSPPKISRRLPDGTLDPSFGEGGQEPLPYFTNSYPRPANTQRLLPLPSGKLIVAGSAVFSEEVGTKTITRVYEIGVLRLDEDGKADPTFGSDGVVKTRTNLGIKSGFSEAEGIAALPGEALVIATGAYTGEGELIGMTAGGALDKGFGSGGTVPEKSTTVDIHANAEGKILVARTDRARRGFTNVGRDLVVSRLEGDGHPDRGYGEGGTTVIDFGGADTLGAVLWEPDGSALLGGGSLAVEPGCTALGLCEETPVLARLDPAGHLDGGFGEGGKVRLTQLTEPTSPERAAGIHALAARPDGGADAAGSSGTTAFVAALGPTAAPVADFGEAGVLTATYPRTGTSSISGVAVDAEQRILVLGKTNSGTEGGTGFVSRLLPSGAPDPAYAGGARSARVPGAMQIVVDRSGGALLLGGYLVTRLTSSGVVDGSFGDHGTISPRPHPNSIVQLHAITALPSGKFLVAGSLGYSEPRAVIFRFNANGSPDRSFGNGGKTELRLGKNTFDLGLTRLLVEPGGRILVGGYLKPDHSAAKRTMMVTRLLPGGRTDRGFGRDGAIYLPVGAESQVSDLELQGGKILVAGTEQRHGHAKLVILRLRHDGRLDRAFGKQGAVRGSHPGKPLTEAGAPVSLLVTPRRLIAVSGSLADPVSAYRPDGKPIPGYGRDGGVVPSSAAEGKAIDGPVAALQGASPILAWSAAAADGHGPTGRIQRLTAP